MSNPIVVLHALLHLVRRRKSPTLAALTAIATRSGADEASVRRAVFALAKHGLVQRTPAGLSLTLAGLAIAVASPKPARSQSGRPGQLARPRTSAPRLARDRARPIRRSRRAA